MNLAIIPAKGASSRLPGKNLRPLAGTPLFLWTVRAALSAESIDRVLVTTDSPEVAELARSEGADVLDRPAPLAADGVEVGEVAVHALGCGCGVDTAVMLLPTSPFRTAEHIDEAMEAFTWQMLRGKADNVVSVCPAPDLKRKLHGLCTGSLKPVPLAFPLYVLNGAIWIAKPERVKADGGFSTVHAIPYVMDEVSGLDIDYPWQWDLAVAVAERAAA